MSYEMYRNIGENETIGLKMNDMSSLYNLIDKDTIWMFITLSMCCDKPLGYEMSSVSKYLEYMNRYLFGKLYKKHNLYLSGYCVRDKKYSNSPNHYHLLISKNDNIPIRKVLDIDKIHHKSMSKVKGLQQYKVDKSIENDITNTYYQRGNIEYVIKHTTGDSKDLYIITIDGII